MKDYPQRVALAGAYPPTPAQIDLIVAFSLPATAGDARRTLPHRPAAAAPPPASVSHPRPLFGQHESAVGEIPFGGGEQTPPAVWKYPLVQILMQAVNPPFRKRNSSGVGIAVGRPGGIRPGKPCVRRDSAPSGPIRRSSGYHRRQPRIASGRARFITGGGNG